MDVDSNIRQPISHRRLYLLHHARHAYVINIPRMHNRDPNVLIILVIPDPKQLGPQPAVLGRVVNTALLRGVPE